MDGFTNFFEKIANLMDYVKGCIDLPMYAASCRPLWNVVMYASVSLGMIVIAWAFWLGIFSRQGANAGAQTPVMRPGPPSPSHQLSGENVDLADVTDPQLALKIQQELERQRIRNITGR